MPSAPRLEPPWRAGLRGARANAAPGLALQAIAVAIAVAYYQHAPTQAVINRLAEIHEGSGVLFGMISTGLFGGALPFLYLRSRPLTRNRFTWAGGAALTVFWAYKGLEFELLYRALARLVGEAADVRTIGIKLVIDQFIYSPTIALVNTILAYAWIEAGFSASAVWSDIRQGRWYRRRVLPVLISNLVVWVPAVCIIYALPTPLQLPLQNLVLCFFTLLLAHLAPGAERVGSPAPDGHCGRST